jgi:hypothetical protein
MTDTMELLRSQETEPPPRTSAARPGPLEKGKQLELAVRLAALVISPIEYIDDEYCQAGPFGPVQIKALAAHPDFRKPLNRLIADMLGFNAAKFEPDMLSQLAASQQARLAVVLASGPMSDAREAALTLAVAALSERIRRAVLKADRDRVREILGPTGFHIAVHEVPLLYSSLCELDALPPEALRFGGGPGTIAGLEEIVAFGFQVMGRFFDAANPVLAELFSRRLPTAVNYGNRERSVRPFGQIHCEQAVKLIRRRQPKWSAIIG